MLLLIRGAFTNEMHHRMNPPGARAFQIAALAHFFGRADTALHWCSSRGRVNICALLVESGANLEARDNVYAAHHS